MINYYASYFHRATINGKTFQLRFLEEVCPDDGKAERSQTTGHIVVSLPRLNKDAVILAAKTKQKAISKEGNDARRTRNPLLEVSPLKDDLDFSQITKEMSKKVPDLDDLPPLEDVED